MASKKKKTKLHESVRKRLEESGALDRYLEGEMVLLCKVEPYDGMSEDEFDAVGKSEGRNVVMYKAIDPSKLVRNDVRLSLMTQAGFDKMASRKELTLNFLDIQGILRTS